MLLKLDTYSITRSLDAIRQEVIDSAAHFHAFDQDDVFFRWRLLRLFVCIVSCISYGCIKEAGHRIIHEMTSFILFNL